MPKLIAMFLLLVAGYSIASLASGASYLSLAMLGGLPIGNALAAIGLCSLPGAAVLLTPMGSARRRLSYAALLGAALWLPTSIALAGNLALNFSGSLGTVWLAMSAVIGVAVLASLAWAVICASFGSRASAA